MAWTNAQKQLAIMACRSHQISEEHRELILRQLPNAMHQGRVTSTSPRLSNTDFEQFMATVESYVPGRQIVIRRGHGRDTVYDPEHWARKLDTGTLARMRWTALRIVQSLIAWLPDWQVHSCPQERLRAWIASRVLKSDDPRQQYEDLEMRLTRQELENLLHGLSAYAKRHDVPLRDYRQDTSLRRCS